MASSDLERRLLEAIEQNPDTTQARLAAQLGVAVGSVNWYVKRMMRKGYVKATQLQRRKLKYFLTPQGLAVKARLTSEYMEASLRLYRKLRRRAAQVLSEVEQAEYPGLHFEGDGEVAEIFRLTCLEQGMRVAPRQERGLPTVRIGGTGYVVDWPDRAALPAGNPRSQQAAADN